MSNPEQSAGSADVPESSDGQATASAQPASLIRWHLRCGYWGLFVFVLLGTGLEAMHGFKLGYYLDVDNEGRRLMWRLAHAHGALLSLLHVAFASSVPRLGTMAWASRLLTVGSWLIPAGFFVAGFDARGAEPGLAVALVPLGACLLLIALWQVARGAGRADIHSPVD